MQKMIAKPASQSETAQQVAQQNQQAAGKTGSNIELEHLEQISFSDNLETANEAAAGDDGVYIGAPPDPIGEESPIGEVILTKDQFFEGVFVPMHAMPGAMLQLQSLPIQSKEMQSARGASDAIYEIAEESSIFRFLIEPGNIWVQRAIAIAAYAIPKSQSVIVEIKAKQAQRQQAANQDQQNSEQVH